MISNAQPFATSTHKSASGLIFSKLLEHSSWCAFLGTPFPFSGKIPWPSLSVGIKGAEIAQFLFSFDVFRSSRIEASFKMISGFNIKKKLVSISLKAKLIALPKPIFLFFVIIFSIF